eukprot:933022-Lingulodinium_polyedra.AAC.1
MKFQFCFRATFVSPGVGEGARSIRVDPRRPGFTRCGWHWAVSSAAKTRSSLFGAEEAGSVPRC